jgi:hypothetical protein
MVVVAIRISLALKLFHYSREIPLAGKTRRMEIIYPIWMRIARGKSQPSDFRNKGATPKVSNRRRRLPTGL